MSEEMDSRASKDAAYWVALTKPAASLSWVTQESASIAWIVRGREGSEFFDADVLNYQIRYQEPDRCDASVPGRFWPAPGAGGARALLCAGPRRLEGIGC